MKLLKYVSGSLLLYFLFFSTGTQLTGCTPDPIFDTLYVRDTLTIRDTVDCNCYDLTDGLVAWYNFNGGSLRDSSGNGNHIAFNNAVATTDRNGKANSAYLFNGTSSYMRVLNSTSLNPTQAITLAAVVKFNDFYAGTCHGNVIFNKINGAETYSNGYYSLNVTDHNCGGPINLDRMKFTGAFGNNYDGNAPYAVSDTTFAKTAKWYSVVFTYENGKSRLYVDGQLINARDFSSFSFVPNTSDVFIGKMNNIQYPYWLNGVIDDIRIYNRALCDGEVKQLNRVKI